MKQGFIYKLSNLDCEDVYIGSTCSKNPRVRLHHHRQMFKQGKQRYGHIFDTENIMFDVIDSIEFNNRHDLLMRERHWMETMKHTVNMNLPCYLNEQERKKISYDKILKFYQTDRGKFFKKLQNERFQLKKKHNILINAYNNETNNKINTETIS